MGGAESDEQLIPEPETIYERTKEEGRRRLSRPFAEEASTALAAGFDIVVGIVVMGLLIHFTERQFGREVAHVIGALGFGVAFIFLIVGRGELFTENFLVPLAGLDHDDDNSNWANLAKLWLTSPVFNIIGGLILILIVTTHSVLPFGTGKALLTVAETTHANGKLALFMSAIFAGALITAMTWFIEGQATMLPRIVIAWIVGFILALGQLNHVIVITLELIFGYRYGASYDWTFIATNFFIAAAGNIVGGIGLVTLNRFTQGKAGRTASA
jgi:formate/nitrite transporter FocA (FNT family)